jgi:hypothetical protein
VQSACSKATCSRELRDGNIGAAIGSGFVYPLRLFIELEFLSQKKQSLAICSSRDLHNINIRITGRYSYPASCGDEKGIPVRPFVDPTKLNFQSSNPYRIWDVETEPIVPTTRYEETFTPIWMYISELQQSLWEQE